MISSRTIQVCLLLALSLQTVMAFNSTETVCDPYCANCQVAKNSTQNCKGGCIMGSIMTGATGASVCKTSHEAAANCALSSEADKCSKCVDDYTVGTDGKCIECKRSANYAKDKKCTAATKVDNCKYYQTDADKCDVCDSGYIKVGEKCVTQLANCVTQSDKDTCT